jgi:hypothetical protein
MTSIWDSYPDLSPSELRNLVAVTAQVLAGSAGSAQLPADPIEMSTGQAARELTGPERGLSPDMRAAVQELLEDDDTAVELCHAVLGEVRRHPELAAEVARAYEDRTRKMAGAELLLLAGALVVLATRIKEIRVGKSGTKVTFSESGEAVKAFLAALLTSIRG